MRRISASGSNWRIRTSRFSEISAANQPCATFSLNSFSISARRCGVTISVSHSARVLSPPAQIIRSFFNAIDLSLPSSQVRSKRSEGEVAIHLPRRLGGEDTDTKRFGIAVVIRGQGEKGRCLALHWFFKAFRKAIRYHLRGT